MAISPENYSEDETRRIVCVYLCVLWFVLAGCVLSVRLARLMKQRSLDQFMVSCIDHCCKSCARHASLLLSMGDTQVAKHVNNEMQQKRLACAQNCIPYGNMAAWIVVGTVFMRTVRADQRANSVVQDACLLVLSFTVLLIYAFPRFVTLRTLDVWSSILAACTALWVSPLAMEGTHAAALVPRAYGVIMVLSVFNLNTGLNLAWLCIVSILTCLAILVGSEGHGDDCGASRIHDVQAVFMTGALNAVILYCFHWAMFLAARWETEADIFRTELVAARSVLSCVCDVVVELDGDFLLQDDSPQLKDMLILNPQRSLMGTDLRSFLASQEDYHKFTSQLRRSLSGDLINREARLSSTFHVHMKDSSNAPIIVETYSVLLHIRDGQVRYLVGIREFTDTNPMSLMTESPSAARRSDLRGREGPRDADPAVVSRETSTSSAWSSASSSLDDTDGTSAVGAPPSKEPEFSVWIDVLSPGYDIKHASPAFAQHVKASGEFLVTVRPSWRPEFIAWVQESCASLLQDGSAFPVAEFSERLYLRPERSSSARRTRVLVSARLGLDLAPHAGAEPGSRGVVRLVLLDTKMIRGRRGDRDGDAGANQPPRSGTPSATSAGAQGRLSGEETLVLGEAAGPHGGLGPAVLGRPNGSS